MHTSPIKIYSPPFVALNPNRMNIYARLPAHLLEKLVYQVEGSGCRPIEPLAAAITQLKYEGSFALVPSEMKRFEEAIQRETIPTKVALMLGDGIEARSFKGKSVSAGNMLSLAVLHRCVDDFIGTLPSVLAEALELCTDTAIDLRWSMTEGPPAVLKAGIGEIKVGRSHMNERTKLAYQETAAAYAIERDSKDPTKNGKPEAMLEVPRPELNESFSWWCLQLGFMLASPHADTPRYVAVIDKIGDHCIRLTSRAQSQARTKSEVLGHIDDRYGSVDNESLPKYARWLLKRGLNDRARLVCELALQHGILPKSTGAFERGIAAAGKKVGTKR